MKIIFFIILIWVWNSCIPETVSAHNPINSYHQPADTLQLPDIVISANRFELSDKERSSAVQRLRPSETVWRTALSAGSLIEKSSIANVRGYGPGALQTVSIQGFSGSQLNVHWGDMSLNHAMVGLVDLSLYPAILIDELVINTNQGSSEYGAHALGGVILLEQNPFSEERQTLRLEAGSYGSQSVQMRYQLPVGNLRVDVAGVLQQQDNDYTYDDVTSNPVETRRRRNADKSLNSLLGTISYATSNSAHETRFWLTDVKSGVPGNIIAPNYGSRQNDGILRGMHKYSRVINNQWHGSLSLTASRHQLDFFDPSTNLESLSKSHHVGLRTGARYLHTPNAQLRMSASHNYGWIRTSEYEAPDRHHTVFQLNGYLKTSLDLGIFPSMRIDRYSDFGSAVSASLGLNQSLTESSRLFTNINRNFAPPTFNDLYWPGLGNSDLVPEVAFKLDFGFAYSKDSFEGDVQIFTNSIDNGIQWLPGNNGQFRPSNIRSVSSTGASLNLQYRFSVFQLAGGYTYLNSRYKSERFPGDQAKGNQLLYQPKHRFNARATSRINNTSFIADFFFTDRRYTTEDNGLWLDPHQTVDLSLQQQIEIGTYSLSASASIENILDENYSQIRFYPMPGRSFHFAIQLTRRPNR
ncbi:MAG: TonB-dependent receptor [Balneolales bacterium]|nr:TonB-dependent receptor [Balneolales bacterium]